MQTYLEQLAANIRLADVLDIGVIAVLLYCTLSWFRQRASWSLAVGLILVAGLFVVARWLDMYLTTQLFQAGFVVVLLTLVVVFQQDIRRAFERLAASGFFGRTRQPAPSGGLVGTLVESLAVLAENKTGALVVLEGHEPLDRHVRGGVEVDGRVSLPLLYSIFHPESPGHDGAVLLRGERIEKLGVHLPLSKNLSEIGHRGTRHAAALGLAEQCDALVLAVSEERGTISIAEKSALREIEPAELTTHLERFIRARSEPGKRSAWYRGVTRNVGLKVAAVSLACALWLLSAYRVETLQRTFFVPIEYRNLHEGWVIDEPQPTHVELTLSGSERAFDLLEANNLAVSFDLDHVRSGTPYSLRTKPSLKGVPTELRVSQIRPQQIDVTVRGQPPEKS